MDSNRKSAKRMTKDEIASEFVKMVRDPKLHTVKYIPKRNIRSYRDLDKYQRMNIPEGRKMLSGHNIDSICKRVIYGSIAKAELHAKTLSNNDEIQKKKDIIAMIEKQMSSISDSGNKEMMSKMLKKTQSELDSLTKVKDTSFDIEHYRPICRRCITYLVEYGEKGWGFYNVLTEVYNSDNKKKKTYTTKDGRDRGYHKDSSDRSDKGWKSVRRDRRDSVDRDKRVERDVYRPPTKATRADLDGDWRRASSKKDVYVPPGDKKSNDNKKPSFGKRFDRQMKSGTDRSEKSDRSVNTKPRFPFKEKSVVSEKKLEIDDFADGGARKKHEITFKTFDTVSADNKAKSTKINTKDYAPYVPPAMRNRKEHSDHGRSHHYRSGDRHGRDRYDRGDRGYRGDRYGRDRYNGGNNRYGRDRYEHRDRYEKRGDGFVDLSDIKNTVTPTITSEIEFPSLGEGISGLSKKPSPKIVESPIKKQGTLKSYHAECSDEESESDGEWESKAGKTNPWIALSSSAKTTPVEEEKQPDKKVGVWGSGTKTISIMHEAAKKEVPLPQKSTTNKVTAKNVPKTVIKDSWDDDSYYSEEDSPEEFDDTEYDAYDDRLDHRHYDGFKPQKISNEVECDEPEFITLTVNGPTNEIPDSWETWDA
jgi:hypothetical protein